MWMYNPIKIDFAEDLKVKCLKDLANYKVVMEVCNMKPNFSQLARELGKDRRTVQKYYEGFEKATTRVKPSQADDYYKLIKELLSEDCIQTFHYIRHLWRYLVDNHDLQLKESSFRYYINKKPEFKQYFEKRKFMNNEPILRFETDPGQQLQIDWKENFKYVTKEGELIYLNVFVGILGYSRYSLYHVTLNRRQYTLFAVLNDIFEKLGGIPKEILNDNMTTIMEEPRTSYRPGSVNQKFEQFSRDYNFVVRACIARRASTKGKVESQMKLIDELDAYQGKFSFEELVGHVEKMNLRKNLEIHPTTKKSPMSLLEYEKDFLSPLPSKEIRSRYYYQQTVKVNSSSMISYQSNQYSVPAEYIGKRLGLEVEDNTLYLYDNTKLITSHPVSNLAMNYLPGHYEQLVASTMPYKSQEEVEAYSKENLERLNAIYGKKG